MQPPPSCHARSPPARRKRRTAQRSAWCCSVSLACIIAYSLALRSPTGRRRAARFLLAATTFAKATVVKKDAKIAKCRGGRQKQLNTKFSWPLACNDAIWYNTLVMQNSIMQNC